MNGRPSTAAVAGAYSFLPARRHKKHKFSPAGIASLNRANARRAAKHLALVRKFLADARRGNLKFVNLTALWRAGKEVTGMKASTVEFIVRNRGIDVAALLKPGQKRR